MLMGSVSEKSERTGTGGEIGGRARAQDQLDDLLSSMIERMSY